MFQNRCISTLSMHACMPFVFRFYGYGFFRSGERRILLSSRAPGGHFEVALVVCKLQEDIKFGP
jgi:hypothetical protein